MQRWANVLELRNDLQRYEVLNLAEQLPTWLEQVALVSDTDTMETDARGRATLITLHSAKGLEFPVVFIAGAEEGLLPIQRAIEAEWTDRRPMEEERRLFYVGITRAEKLLYITYTGGRALYGQYRPSVASRFLAQIPELHIDSQGSRAAARSAQQSGSSLTGRLRSGNIPVPSVPTPTAPPKPKITYTPGQKIFHSKFGEGVILEAETRRDGDQELSIAFSRHGQKRLIAGLANLDIIE